MQYVPKQKADKDDKPPCDAVEPEIKNLSSINCKQLQYQHGSMKKIDDGSRVDEFINMVDDNGQINLGQSEEIQEKAKIYVIVVTQELNRNQKNIEGFILKSMILSKLIRKNNMYQFTKENMQMVEKIQLSQANEWVFQAEVFLYDYYVLLGVQSIKYKEGGLIVFNIYPNLKQITNKDVLTKFFAIHDIPSKDQTTLLAKNRKYYIYMSKAEDLESQNLDYKYYDIKSSQNNFHLTKSITSYLNADRFEDQQKTAGTLLIGVDDKQRRFKGMTVQTQQYEYFESELTSVISKSTYPDIHSYVEIKRCELLFFNGVDQHFYPLNLLNYEQERTYIIEINVFRYPKDLMVAFKEGDQRSYYQRKSSSNRKLLLEELVKYVPDRLSREDLSFMIAQWKGSYMSNNKKLELVHKQFKDLQTYVNTNMKQMQDQLDQIFTQNQKLN